MNPATLAEVGLGWLWRMSWQASVLVLLVLLAQRIFRNRLKSQWRFNLWWLVLLRLMLPATPESAWSIFNLAPAAHRPEHQLTLETLPLAHDIVETDHVVPENDALISELDAFATRPIPSAMAQKPAPMPPVEPQPKKELSIFSWLACLWMAGVVVHGGWLVMGGVRLSQSIRRDSTPLDADVMTIFNQCRRSMGILQPPEIIVTSLVQSPALFGFIHIKLLIPTGLTATLSHDEWRHIFMHELAHIRRRDVELNWVMAMLNALHWFNPIVRFAFKRMSADRELACDAMALAYARQDEARAYGFTIVKLLEGLAKPAPIPGLVGIMEDTSQIKQRIHMIAQYKPSQRRPLLAVLLLAVLCMIAMTDAQTKPTNSDAKDEKPSGAVETNKASGLESYKPNAPIELLTNSPSAESREIVTGGKGEMPVTTATANPTNKLTRLVQDGKLLLEKGQYEIAEKKLRQAIKEDPHYQPAIYYLSLVQEARFAQEARTRGVSSKEKLVKVEEAWSEPTQVGVLHNQDNVAVTSVVKTGPGRQKIQSKLASIILDEFKVPEGTDLRAVITELDTEVRKRDPEKQGINFVMASGPYGRAPLTAAGPGGIDPATGAANATGPADNLVRNIGLEVTVGINPPLRNVPVSYILEVITRVAEIKGNNPQFYGVRYTIEDHAVVFSQLPANPSNPTEADQLVSKTFRVDLNTFIQGLERATAMNIPPTQGQASGGTNVHQAAITIQDYVRQFFTTATGIEFGGGRVNSTNQPLSSPIRPMFFNDRTGVLYVRAKLSELELLEEAIQALNIAAPQINLEATLFEVPQESARALTSISDLISPDSSETDSQKKSSADDLKYPFPKLKNIFTDAQFKLLEHSISEKTGVKAWLHQIITTLNNRECQFEQDEGRCALTILPTVDPDGYSINVKIDFGLAPKSKSFLPGNGYSHTVKTRMRIATNIAVQNGQTAILTCLSNAESDSQDVANPPRKTLYILCVTPTLIDPAGNRMHSEE